MDRRTILALILGMLLGAEALWYLLSWNSAKAPGLRADAGSQEISIPLYSLWAPSGTVTKSWIEDSRAQASEAGSHFISGSYRHGKGLLTQMKDSKPWLSVQNHFVLGPDSPFFQGSPAEGLGLINPLLLVRPDFIGLSAQGKAQWDRTRATDEALRSPDFPFIPLPESLKWNGATRTGSVTYNISSFVGKLNNWIKNSVTPRDASFDVAFYNAVDFNLLYISFDPERSENITTQNPGPFPAIQFLRDVPNGCGKGTDCNMRWPSTSPFRIFQVNAIPASAVFHMWTNPPEAGAEPDVNFVISLR